MTGLRDVKNVESDWDKFIEIVVAFGMLIIAGVIFWVLAHISGMWAY